MGKIKTFLASIDWAYGFGAVTGMLWRALAWVWAWIKARPGASWASLKTFLTLPQVWVAMVLFLLVGFWIGELRSMSKVASANAEQITLVGKIAGLEGQNAKLSDDLRIARKIIAEMDERKPEATPPVAAVSPPAVKKTAVAAKKPKPVAIKPATGWW